MMRTSFRAVSLAVLAVFAGAACGSATRHAPPPRPAVASPRDARPDPGARSAVVSLMSDPRTRALLYAWQRTPDLAPVRRTVPTRSVRFVLEVDANGKVAAPSTANEVEGLVEMEAPRGKGSPGTPFRIVLFHAADSAPFWWATVEDPREIRYERPGPGGHVLTTYERRAPAFASVRIPFEPGATIAWFEGPLPTAEPTGVFRLGPTPDAPVQVVFAVKK